MSEITKWLVNIKFTEIAFEQRAERGKSRCIGMWGRVFQADRTTCGKTLRQECACHA